MRRRQLSAIAIGALTMSVAPVMAQAAAGGPNAIYNPDFAHGLRGWRTVVVARGTDPGYPHISVPRAPVEPLLKCVRAQRGHPYLELNVPAGSNGYVEQDIIVPVNPGRLTFRTWGDLEPVKATISIVDGPIVHKLLSYTPPPLQATPTSCSSHRPITESLDISRYAGQAVGLRIQATAIGLTGTVVDLDNVGLGGR
jgi:hypothetical protein